MGTDNKTIKMMSHAGPRGFMMVLAYIGAAIYFVEQAGNGFLDVVLALLQAIVWPVYVIYHVLQFLGA